MESDAEHDSDFLSDERLRMLFDTIREVNSPLPIDELIVRIVDRALEMSGAERGILILRCGDGEPRVRVARDADGCDLPLPVEFSHVVTDRVLRTGEAERHEIDMAESGEFPLTDSILRLGLRTVMCVPLHCGEDIGGTLYVDSKIGISAPFRESDLSLFSALADQTAIAIENGRLREAEVRRKVLEDRMRIAGEIQQALFPPGGLRETGYDIHGLSRPCDTVGGDYFDYVPCGNGQVSIVQGDVAGHGLHSALYMLTARAHLRSTLRWEHDPVRAFLHINGELERAMPLGKFMTFLQVDLDVAERTIRYVNAGHEPPRLYRRKTDEFEVLKEHGPAFTLVPKPSYRLSEPVQLDPGDVLVLATDGIQEARRPDDNGGREFFGTERLERIVRSTRDRPAFEIVHEVLNSVRDFHEGAPVDDDLTLVILKVLD